MISGGGGVGGGSGGGAMSGLRKKKINVRRWGIK